MNQLVCDFLENRLSRRGFAAALTALGLSAAGVRSTVPSHGRDAKFVRTYRFPPFFCDQIIIIFDKRIFNKSQ